MTKLTMIIGIDGNEANVERKVGISEYAFELLRQFAKLNIAGCEFRVYLKERPRPEMPAERDGFKYIVFGPKKLWTQFALPFKLFTSFKKPDVFFTPSHYAPRFSPVPTAIAIMDVAYLKFPNLFNEKDLYQLKNWTAYSVRNAKKIFTISNSSRDDILKEYHLAKDKVVVTYPGLKENLVSLQPMVYGMEQLQSKFGISKHYFLFVGTLQPRKNITRLIEAFAKLTEKEKNNDLQLIIVGKKGWQYEEILSAPGKFGVTQSVKFLDFVSDEELKVLYAHAIAYVLPSLYEGFGLPILEAYQNNCPVITSNVSSLPEAAGDGALYVDPEKVEDITKAMKKLLDDKTLRKKLIENGKKQLQKFSWEETAKETLSVLEQIAKQ